MTYEVAYSIPFGELCDLIAIEQIKAEGAKARKTKEQEEAEFWQMMTWK